MGIPAFLPGTLPAHASIHVSELSETELSETFKTTSVIEKQLILQDLLVEGQKMDNLEARNKTQLAATLYLKLPNEYQKAFQMYLIAIPQIYKNFREAVIANSQVNQCVELEEKGASGLSAQELQKERSLAISFLKISQIK